MSLYKLDQDDDEIDFEDKEPYCETLDDSGADLATIQPIQKNTSFCTLDIFTSCFFLSYFTFCLLFWLFWHVVKDLNLYNYRRGRFKSKWLSLFVIEVIKTSQLYIEHIRQRKFFYFHNFSSWNLCQNLLSKDPQFPNTKWQKLKFPAQVFRLDLAARGSFFLLIC